MSLWNEALESNEEWLDSFELADDFVLDGSGWSNLLLFIYNILEDSKLGSKVGGCYHFTNTIPEFLLANEKQKQFYSAVDNFQSKFKLPFDFGLHCSYRNVDMPLAPKYHVTLQHDIELCKLIRGSVIAQHPPENHEDCIDSLVKQFTSDEIVNVLKNQKITICWENIDSPFTTDIFFGSLKNLVEFRDNLTDKLKEIGIHKDFEDSHQFCFDTGHLLLWRDQNPDGINYANREIDEYLPIFARNIKIFHIHVNDGKYDSHFIPYSANTFDTFSKKEVNQNKVQKYSDDIIEWLKICNENRGKSINGLHWHLENLTLPFSKKKIIDFGKKINRLFN